MKSKASIIKRECYAQNAFDVHAKLSRNFGRTMPIFEYANDEYVL